MQLQLNTKQNFGSSICIHRIDSKKSKLALNAIETLAGGKAFLWEGPRRSVSLELKDKNTQESVIKFLKSSNVPSTLYDNGSHPIVKMSRIQKLLTNIHAKIAEISAKQDIDMYRH